MTMQNILQFDLTEVAKAIATQLGLESRQVTAAIELLDAGNTIPFIARYRKEATRGLDEIALRSIEDAIDKARDLFDRKNTILKSISEQQLLTPELQAQILNCSDLQTLEALYLPFKPKRRTRATVARERGLQPLADILLKQLKIGIPKRQLLQRYVRPEADIPNEETALAGAMDIVAETWADDAEIRIWLADYALKFGRIASQVKRGKKDEATKFEMYVDHNEAVARVPSHRFLAMKRGEEEGILRLSLELEWDRIAGKLHSHFVTNPQFEFYSDLQQTVTDCFERLLQPVTQSSLFQILKERADSEAIAVFGKNLRDLLLAPPAGPKITLGIDPGFRTGCKLAVVDRTGQFLAHHTIYPTPPMSDTSTATKTLLDLIAKYKVELIAIGNGTASRETDLFVGEVIRAHNLTVTKVIVSEAGASVYSASELAGKEYPNLDVTVRGAISIAHRLQDPLAELVKTDPKTIGVGQYQHDVNQTLLRKCLEREVESCVNRVGVDLNTASVSLLSYVSGIGPKLAENIVKFRNENGPFRSREQLVHVPKLGPKAFEQSAGFLRIRDAEQALDNSAVHPEAYGVVKKMASHLGVPTGAIVGNALLVQKLKPEDFVNEQFGLPTLIDIMEELTKPGRDPRKEFYAVKFSEHAKSIDDLKSGMILEGVITNVTHFGAFVDIGVHQDGLIHISQLSDSFIKDPNDIVSVGHVVKVKVMEVDISRKRISLTRKF
jgi:uncharacterized protein